MATGSTRYADVSSLINDIYEGSLFVLRSSNKVLQTVTMARGQGMAPRKVTQRSAANVRQVGEGEDVTPTKFDKNLLATLTPYAYADQFLLTDQMVATDNENIREQASRELGSAFSEYVDSVLVDIYSSFTGGTVGTAGSALTWTNIFNARAILEAGKVPGPYWCVLHPYQYVDLANAVATGSAFVQAQSVQDEVARNYYVSAKIDNVNFVVSPHVNIDASDDATGAMYSSLALMYDERKAFGIEAQRDSSRYAWELNASLWFGHGIWDASRGVKIVSDATTPS